MERDEKNRTQENSQGENRIEHAADGRIDKRKIMGEALFIDEVVGEKRQDEESKRRGNDAEETPVQLENLGAQHFFTESLARTDSCLQESVVEKQNDEADPNTGFADFFIEERPQGPSRQVGERGQDDDIEQIGKKAPPKSDDNGVFCHKN